MNEHRQQEERLSAVGASRRDAMLSALQESVVVEGRRRRRRRAIARVAAGGVAAVAIVVVSVSLFMQTGSVERAATPGPVADSSVTESTTSGGPADDDTRAADAPARLVARVESDGSALERYRVAQRVDVAEVAISDDALLDALAGMGRPAGMVKSQGRVWLTAAVTDDAIGHEDRGAGG